MKSHQSGKILLASSNYQSSCKSKTLNTSENIQQSPFLSKGQVVRQLWLEHVGTGFCKYTHQNKKKGASPYQKKPDRLPPFL